MLDFGIATAASSVKPSGETRTGGRIAFTAAYAAPEQIRGTRTGPWTDVHALALLFTELVTGARPYEENRELAQAVSPMRPSPRERGVDVGVALESVLERALALEPGARPENAAVFVRDMDAALEVLATPTGGLRTPAAAPIEKSSPTHRIAFGIGAVLCAGGVALGASWLWFVHPSDRWTAARSTARTANVIGPAPSAPSPIGAARAEASPLPSAVHVDQRIPDYTAEQLRSVVARSAKDPSVTRYSAPQLSTVTISGWNGDCLISVSMQWASEASIARSAAAAQSIAGAHFVALDGTRVLAITDRDGCSGALGESLLTAVPP